MRNKIKLKIQKAQAQADFNVEIMPRRRRKIHPDFIQAMRTDEFGNHVTKDGDLILTHVRTEGTLTPSEQYRKSRFGKGK